MSLTKRLIENLSDVALGRPAARGPLVETVDRENLVRHLHGAYQNANVDEMPQPAGRMPFAKRAVLKFSRFALVRQRAVNQSLITAVGELATQLESIDAGLEQERRRSAAVGAGLDELMARAEERQAAVLDELRQSWDAHVMESQPRHASTEERLLALEARLARLDASRVSGPSTVGPADQALIELYERFESRFRPAEQLESRLSEYLDDLRPYSDLSAPIVDIGTGRGDFLVLLTSEGFLAIGVDSNAESVALAKAAGLDVTCDDALVFLRALDSGSVAGVTMFHVAEHLDPAVLVRLVDAAIDAIRPGGILIIETPNPTNLVVGASSFYHDPTHLRPITPQYLAFLVEDRGFVDVETRFLHPLPAYRTSSAEDADAGEDGLAGLVDDLWWAMKGPQDYAVIARRPAV